VHLDFSHSERRVPELISVLGSQPAGDVSHKPGGRLVVSFYRYGTGSRNMAAQQRIFN